MTAARVKAVAVGVAWFLLILAPGSVYGFVTYGDGPGPEWFSVLVTPVEMMAALTVGFFRYLRHSRRTALR